MTRFVQGFDRTQTILFPGTLDEYVAEDNPVRVIEAFVETLNLVVLGFDGMVCYFRKLISARFLWQIYRQNCSSLSPAASKQRAGKLANLALVRTGRMRCHFLLIRRRPAEQFRR